MTASGREYGWQMQCPCHHLDMVVYIYQVLPFADLNEVALKHIVSFLVQLLLKFPLEILNLPTAQPATVGVLQ